MKTKLEKYLNTIISLICLVVTVLVLLKTASVQDELNAVKISINSNYANLSSDIYSISSNVSSVLQEGAGILAKAEFYMGQLDTESLTIPVKFTVTPREFSDSATALLYISDKTYDMSYSNGSFECTLNKNIYDNIEADKVIFTDGEKHYAQTVPELSVNIKDCFLPYIYTSAPLSSSYSTNNNTLRLDLHGDINIDYNYPSENSGKIKSAKAIITLNNEILETHNLELYDNGNYSNGYYNLSRRLEVPAGSTLDITVESKDSLGLTYKTVLYHIETDANGEVKTDYFDMQYGSYKVYDQNNNMIFENNY